LLRGGYLPGPGTGLKSWLAIIRTIVFTRMLAFRMEPKEELNCCDWVWSQIEAIPMDDGFLNKWLASIPVGEQTVECIGVCLVQFDEQGKIKRNEVYFDRTELVSAICQLKSGA
jgi:hypothetical protein